MASFGAKFGIGLGHDDLMVDARMNGSIVCARQSG